MRKTDEDWNTWGKKDPYFGVLTEEKFRKGNIDAHREEFFGRGERKVAQALGRIEAAGPLPKGRALDFGSGVGRLTIPLARRFGSVVGVDISDAMRAEAAKNVNAEGLSNVRFVASDDTLSQVTGSFDFVLTRLVLQHIPPERGLNILQRMLRSVGPGGGFSVDMSFRDDDSWRSEYIYWKHRTLWRLGRVPDAPMKMHHYPASHVLRTLAEAGFEQSILTMEDHGGGVVVGVLEGRRATPSR